MELTVYLDESGRTGIEKYDGEKWNFSSQFLFGIGGVVIRSIDSEMLRNDIETFILKEKIQGEFKWSNKEASRRSAKLIPALLSILEHDGAFPIFEIEDKRFAIAKNITEYCILPYYSTIDINDFELCVMKKSFASYICDFIKDPLLSEFASLFDSASYDIEKMICLIKKIIEESKSNIVKEYCQQTIEEIQSLKNRKKAQSFFPICDSYNHGGKGSPVAVDPHTDCFSDLLCKVIYMADKCTTINCIHDEQFQWEPALREAVKRINEFECSNVLFRIQKGNDIIINTADYILGYLKNNITTFLKENKHLDDEAKSLCNNNLVLVSSMSIQEQIFKDNPIVENELKTVRDLYNQIAFNNLQ